MKSLKEFDELWASYINRINLDSSKKEINFLLWYREANLFKYWEVSFKEVKEFIYDDLRGTELHGFRHRPSYQIEFSEIYTSIEGDLVKFEILIWDEDRMLTILCKDWDLKLLKEFETTDCSMDFSDEDFRNLPSFDEVPPAPPMTSPETFETLQSLKDSDLCETKLDLLLGKATLYVRIKQGNSFQEHELSLHGLYHFNVKESDSTPNDPLHVKDIHAFKEDDRFKFEITLDGKDQMITIVCQHWKLKLVKEFAADLPTYDSVAP